MPQKIVKGGNNMDKVEKKLAKKIEAKLKRTLKWNSQVIITAKSKNEKLYDVLMVNHKDGVFYVFRVYDKSVALINHNIKGLSASKQVTKVLYDFLIA